MQSPPTGEATSTCWTALGTPLSPPTTRLSGCNPEVVGTYNARGTAHLYFGNQQEAIDDYTQAITLVLQSHISG